MNNFVILPRVILETEKISNSAKIVYLKLVDFAFNNIYCYPTVATLAERVKMSEKTVKNAVKELREVGLVKIYKEGYKKSNRYVLMPVEWVDNIMGEELKIVAEEEQYLKDEEDYKATMDKIKEHYESIGKKLTDVTVEKKAETKKRASKSKRKTSEEVLAEAKRIAEEGGKLNAQQYCHIYKDLFYEIRGELYTVNWAVDGNFMKKLFIDRDLPSDIVIQILRKYIEVYDRYFKRGNYTSPKIRYLAQDFIFNKIVDLCDADLREQNRTHDELANESF